MVTPIFSEEKAILGLNISIDEERINDIEAAGLTRERMTTIQQMYNASIALLEKEGRKPYDNDSDFMVKVLLQPSELKRERLNAYLEYATEETKREIAEGRLKVIYMKYNHLKPLDDKQRDKLCSVTLIQAITRVYDDCMEKLIRFLKLKHISLDRISEDKLHKISWRIGGYASACAIAEWNFFQANKSELPTPLNIKISPHELEGPKIQNPIRFSCDPPYSKRFVEISDRDKWLNKIDTKKHIAENELLSREFAKKCAIQLDRIRLYAFVAKQLEKNVNELSENEVHPFLEPFENHKKDEILKTFQVEEPSKKPHSKRKKSKPKRARRRAPKQPHSAPCVETKPAAPVLSEMQKKIIELNGAPKNSEFRVHNRVLRWQHYGGDPFDKDRHNLAAMIRFIADRELCEQLSLPYSWRNGNQQGRVFFAEMIRGAEKKFGCINAAIGRDKVVFHVMWRELYDASLPYLQEVLQANPEEEPLQEEIGFKQVSDYSFQLSQDEKNFELHVGKEDPVIFRFHNPNR